MSRDLGSMANKSLVSRDLRLAVVRGLVIDNSVHPKDELIYRGTLMGKLVSGGKYRAYAEGTVQTTAFATNSVNFQVDPSGSTAKHFRVGDVIESTGGSALGTIATFNPNTGVGTLTANSTNALSVGNTIRIATSVLSISGADGKLLQDDIKMEANDMPVPGYVEGYFVYASTTVTSAAITAMGAHALLSGTELRLK